LNQTEDLSVIIGGFNFEVQQSLVALRPIRGEMFIERATAKRILFAPAERKMSESLAQGRTACGSKQMPPSRLEAKVQDAISKLNARIRLLPQSGSAGVALPS